MCDQTRKRDHRLVGLSIICWVQTLLMTSYSVAFSIYSSEISHMCDVCNDTSCDHAHDVPSADIADDSPACWHTPRALEGSVTCLIMLHVIMLCSLIDLSIICWVQTLLMLTTSQHVTWHKVLHDWPSLPHSRDSRARIGHLASQMCDSLVVLASSSQILRFILICIAVGRSLQHMARRPH